MTDDHGSEQVGQEGEHQGADNFAQPPVDDFADPEHGDTGEVATVEETTEVPTEATTAEAGNPAAKLIFRGIVGVIVLFVGAIIYFQFLSKPANVPQPKVQTAKTTEVEKPVTAIPPIPSPAPNTPKDTVTAEVAQDIASLKSLTAVAPEPGTTTQTNNVPNNNQNNNTLTPPSDSASAVGTSIAAQQALPVATAALGTNQNLDTKIVSLNARVADLQSTVDHTTEQLNKLSTLVAGLQNVAPPPATNNQALEDRILKIEQDVSKLESAALGTDLPKPTHTDDKLTVNQEATPAVHATPVTKTPHHKTSTAAVQGKTPTEPKTLKVVTSWVLRAATADEAWVSKTAESSDLRHVKVGDTLNAVGRIKTITQEGDNWVITGTKGKIE